MPGRKPDEPLVTPFTVVIDTREQRPFSFAGLVSDAREGRRPLHVLTEVRGLATGDYSLAGHERHVALERKSLADLYGTIGQGRERFVRELQRMAELSLAAVIIEATWPEVVAEPPPHTKLPGKVVMRSILAWMTRFPRIHWVPAGPRRLAEITTFRLLERYWRDHRGETAPEGS